MNNSLTVYVGEEEKYTIYYERIVCLTMGETIRELTYVDVEGNTQSIRFDKFAVIFFN